MRRVASLLLFTSLLAGTALPAQTPVERFHAAEARWAAHRPDGGTLSDDSQAARDALEQMWSVAHEVVLAITKAQPATDPETLRKALLALEPKPDHKPDSSFGPRLSASAIQLNPNTFAVAFNDEVAGTVFLVGATAGPSSVLWSLPDANAQPVDTTGLLRAWEPTRQGEACRKAQHGGNAGLCGPLTASLNAFGPDGAGHPRFLVDATYSQDMGATFGKQASIWAWDGAAPHLLWIHPYNINADQRFGMSYNEGTLAIGEKGQFKTFFACGACDGRQLIHSVRLTDAGVDDLGTRSTVPELDALDALVALVASPSASTAENAAALASPGAIATLEPLIAKGKASSAKVGPQPFSLGMLQSSSVHTEGGVQHVCFITEKTGHLEGTLEHRADQLYVASLKTAPAGRSTCP